LPHSFKRKLHHHLRPEADRHALIQVVAVDAGVAAFAACRKEVELNSTTAPGLYLGVRRITRQVDGG
jgi:hypothetical protein